MSAYASMQAVAARLLVDPAFRARFYGGVDDGGLSREELEVVRRIPESRLNVISEGYTGKRFERVESLFPHALRFLDTNSGGHRDRYLKETPFPRDREGERAAFREHYLTMNEGTPDYVRLLGDLVRLDEILQGLRQGALPSRAFDPRGRILNSRAISHGAFAGALHKALPAWPRAVAYPAAGHEYAIWREGPSIQLLPMTPDVREALTLATGGPASEGGAGDEALRILRFWFSRGLVTQPGSAAAERSS